MISRIKSALSGSGIPLSSLLQDLQTAAYHDIQPGTLLADLTQQGLFEGNDEVTLFQMVYDVAETTHDKDFLTTIAVDALNGEPKDDLAKLERSKRQQQLAQMLSHAHGLEDTDPRKQSIYAFFELLDNGTFDKTLTGVRAHAALLTSLRTAGFLVLTPNTDSNNDIRAFEHIIGADCAAITQTGEIFFIDAKAASGQQVITDTRNMRPALASMAAQRTLLGTSRISDQIYAEHRKNVASHESNAANHVRHMSVLVPLGYVSRLGQPTGKLVNMIAEVIQPKEQSARAEIHNLAQRFAVGFAELIRTQEINTYPVPAILAELAESAKVQSVTAGSRLEGFFRMSGISSVEAEEVLRKFSEINTIAVNDDFLKNAADAMQLLELHGVAPNRRISPVQEQLIFSNQIDFVALLRRVMQQLDSASEKQSVAVLMSFLEASRVLPKNNFLPKNQWNALFYYLNEAKIEAAVTEALTRIGVESDLGDSTSRTLKVKRRLRSASNTPVAIQIAPREMQDTHVMRDEAGVTIQVPPIWKFMGRFGQPTTLLIRQLQSNLTLFK